MKKNNQYKMIKNLTLIIIMSLFILSPIVVNAEVTDISISGTRKMKIGEFQKLTTEVKKTDDDTNTYNVLFSSSATDIVTVDAAGKVTAIKGGTASIIIQVENTSIQKTFEIVVEDEQSIAPILSSDNTLKSLSVEGYELDKEFDKDETKYEVTIPATVKSLKLKYEKNDSKAKEMITGNSSLKDGDIIRIVVTAEDGTTKTYEIKVNNEKINLNLSSIKVLGQSLNETFKSSQTRYTLTVAYEISALSIEAKCEDPKAKVEISGNESLSVGTNTVTITVKAQDSNDKKVYTILVTREKETDNNKPTTSGSTSTITSDSSTSNGNSGGSTATGGGSSNMAKYVLVTIGCLVLFAIGGIGIYFYVKTAEPKANKGKKNKKNVSTSQKRIVETEEVVEEKSIYDYEEETYNDDLEDTKEFNKEELTRASKTSSTPSSNSYKYDDDVLKDIEDLFED